MASSWDFPTSLNVGGKEYDIRTDFRAVLDLLTALNDEELTDKNPHIEAYMKGRVILEIMFPKCDDIPEEYIQEAIDKVAEFIDMGIADGSRNYKTMDWEQDAPILIPAINKVLNKEVRAEKYLHWWTFLGAYMEIGESLFTNVVSIRLKKAKGKKLEKHEQEFYRENRSLIDFETKKQRSNEEKNIIDDYFFGHKKNK